jgi:dihydroxyacetone kinase-like protein
MSLGRPDRQAVGAGATAVTITAEDVVAFIGRAATTIARHEALLDRLDAALGDGDHGTNMTTGLQAVVRALTDEAPAEAVGPLDVGALLRRIGHTLVGSVGGASGPLYGTLFIEMGFALDGRHAVDLPTLARALDAGRAGLARRGRCALGDKTILDALEPATRALLAGAATELPPDEAFVRAARAARAGVRATIPLIARRGLALRLGERSRGHRDPGATSCFLLIRSMLDGRTRRRPPVRPQ